MILKSNLVGCDFLQDNKIKIIAVVGPTASGKTKLSIELAKRYDGEIISADSIQIYKSMDIASAKPTKNEMQGIHHHLIDFLDIDKTFSVAEYVPLAKSAINEIHSKNKLPILCGGTGLYIDSLLNNISFETSNSDHILREKLKKQIQEKGVQSLIDELQKFDPESAKKIHPNNVIKIIRAIEIYKTTGITMTDQIKRSRLTPSFYDTLFIGLDYKDRNLLYDRINKRVDLMLENGLLEEAQGVLNKNHNLTAINAIGYKELKPYLNGTCSLNECIDKLKQQSRRYAKRQLTWFRKNKNINWLYIDNYKNFDQLIEESIKYLTVFRGS